MSLGIILMYWFYITLFSTLKLFIHPILGGGELCLEPRLPWGRPTEARQPGSQSVPLALQLPSLPHCIHSGFLLIPELSQIQVVTRPCPAQLQRCDGIGHQQGGMASTCQKVFSLCACFKWSIYYLLPTE